MEHHFDGETYRAAWDYDRLKNALQRVLWVLLDGKMHHILDLRKVGGDAAATRVRDLRKPWCGSMRIPEYRDATAKSKKDRLSSYRLDLTSVREKWVRGILNGDVKEPKKKDGLPDDPEEMRHLLEQAIAELVQLEDIQHAKNAYKHIMEKITKHKTPAPGSGAPEGHPDREPDKDAELIFDLLGQDTRLGNDPTVASTESSTAQGPSEDLLSFLHEGL